MIEKNYVEIKIETLLKIVVTHGGEECYKRLELVR